MRKQFFYFFFVRKRKVRTLMRKKLLLLMTKQKKTRNKRKMYSKKAAKYTDRKQMEWKKNQTTLNRARLDKPPAEGQEGCCLKEYDFFIKASLIIKYWLKFYRSEVNVFELQIVYWGKTFSSKIRSNSRQFNVDCLMTKSPRTSSLCVCLRSTLCLHQRHGWIPRPASAGHVMQLNCCNRVYLPPLIFLAIA